MPSPSNHGAATRRPVVFGGKRIPNMTVRTTDSGVDVYEVRMRLPDGTHPRIKLDAMTPTDAVRERNGLLVDRDRGVERENHLMNPTVAEAMDEFLASVAARIGIKDDKRRLAKATLEHYRGAARTHVVPLLGRKRVADVTWRDVRRLVEYVEGKGLAPATVSHAFKTINVLLAFAETNGYVDRNVARDVPREYRPGSQRVSEPRYLTRDEVDRLLTHSPDKYRAAWACCVYAGLRISEALGLQWECVDLKADTITIRQQAGRDGLIIPNAKTKASAATVPVFPALKRELLAHRSRLAEKDLRRVRPDALLFVGTRGQMLSAPQTHWALGRAADRAGLNPDGVPRLGQHDLRHTCAALALQSGANVAEVAELMRHANPMVTMRVYAGLTAEGKGGAVRKMLAAGFGV